MDQYLNVFIDKEYPSFIDKYLKTNTMQRLKHITQFCGCDYTKLYNPLFLFTRYDHSLIVAHMTWHFSHNKKETIISLLHDVGTPCFSHTIDYVLGDYENQESSEKNIKNIIKLDKELLLYLKEDQIDLEDFDNLSLYHILENSSPKLCTDRLDGVLHTAYIWIHSHSLDQIKRVYDDLVVLKNEDNIDEMGFKTQSIAEEFTNMVYKYSIELQGNKDKYVMEYISRLVKESVSKKLISLDDLYIKKEIEICNIFNNNFESWKTFNKEDKIISTNKLPKDHLYISINTKKRKTIPLISAKDRNKRITEVSKYSKKIYDDIEKHKDKTYAYIENIKKL